MVGKQYQEAMVLLTNAGFAPSVSKRVSECSEAPGIVYAQSPAPGKALEKGADIQLEIVAKRRVIPARKAFGKGEPEILMPGRSYSQNAWALKNTGVEFSLQGDECTEGEVTVAHPLGGTKVHHLTAGQLKSNTRFFGAGPIDISFKSNNKNAKLHVKVW